MFPQEEESGENDNYDALSEEEKLRLSIIEKDLGNQQLKNNVSFKNNGFHLLVFLINRISNKP